MTKDYQPKNLNHMVKIINPKHAKTDISDDHMNMHSSW